MGNKRHARLTHLMTAILLFSSIMLLSGCHSSKKTVVKGSQGKQSEAVVNRQRPYDDMKREVQEIRTGIEAITQLIAEAGSWLGTPYLYGGHDRSGTDCSGMVMEVFDKVLGAKLPRNSRDQQNSCQPISTADMLPGDLVFFATGRDPHRTSHVGLYIGNNEMIHASSSRGVIVSNLAERYYTTHFHGVGRHPSIGLLYSSTGQQPPTPTTPTPQQPPTPQTPTQASIATPTTPAPIVTPPASIPEELTDDIITQKIDSIYSGFFD